MWRTFSQDLLQRARTLGLTHPRSGRHLFRSELHRLLQNPIYYGDFLWDGKRYTGSHQPLITRELFDDAQAVFRGRPRARYPKQRHPFMGLLTCAKCGCAITAERKKGKYVYYHCTDYHGECENTYIREERLGELLADVIKPIQITPEIAEDIASALRSSDDEAERQRAEALRQLEQRCRSVVAKLDRGYDYFVEGRITEEFWTRKSHVWEAELRVIEEERARVEQVRPATALTAEKTLELAKQAENLYKSQDPTEQRRLLEIVLSNCTFDAGTLCPTYASPFDLLARV